MPLLMAAESFATSPAAAAAIAADSAAEASEENKPVVMTPAETDRSRGANVPWMLVFESDMNNNSIGMREFVGEAHAKRLIGQRKLRRGSAWHEELVMLCRKQTKS